MTAISRTLPDWLNVSRETLERLGELESLVVKWTVAVNLISKSSVPEIWPRHILDSAQISVLSDPTQGAWVDLGSGAGFPALVLAIIAKERSGDATFTLIESDSRKAAFLMQAVRAMDLSANVIVKRIDEVPPLNADILTARALAPLDSLLDHAARHLRPTGRAFFPKGASFQDEVNTARQRWKFRCTAHKSLTDPLSAILEVDGIELH